MEKTIEQLIAERDEALQIVKRLLENYRDNDRQGLGIAPIFIAQAVLRKHEIKLDGEE